MQAHLGFMTGRWGGEGTGKNEYQNFEYLYSKILKT